jgi:RND family efflux transporter MFP subunit
MTIKRVIIILFGVLILIVGLNYITVSLRRAAAPPQPSKEPSLPDTPERLYGLVEPLGRETYVGPLQARRVVEIFVKEGQTVKAGDALCRLDDDLEKLAEQIAELRVEEAKRDLAITLDDLRRNQTLAQSNAVSEFDAKRLELQSKLLEQRIEIARAELSLRRTERDKLTLRSPIDGIVYKFDVRVGEQLTPEDYKRIVIGSPKQQVRLFVESFWLGRVRVGTRYRVFDSETREELGTGQITEISPYVGTRDFRTEDRLERLDTKYAQAVLTLDSPKIHPLGLQVLCERAPSN